MYRVKFTPSAQGDLAWFRKYDQQRIIAAIETQLLHQPGEVTSQRKHLRPNRLAEWELRSGHYRIFYDVHDDEIIVAVVAVGYKDGNILYIRGKEYHL